MIDHHSYSLAFCIYKSSKQSEKLRPEKEITKKTPSTLYFEGDERDRIIFVSKLRTGNRQ